MHGNDGLTDFVHAPLVGQLGGVLDHHHFAIGLDDLVDHAGRGGDEVLVKLTLQALLHDLHVQQTQKSATETKTQRLADFRLVLQRGIVELEFFQRIAQLVVLAGFGRVQTGKHLGLDFLEARQGLGSRTGVVGQLFFQRDGIAHLGCLQLFDASNDVAHLARIQRIARLVGRRENANVVGVVDRTRGHHLEALALEQTAIDHAHQHYDAYIGVKPAVNDHRAQRAARAAFGRWHLGHHGFEDLVNTHAGLGRARDRVRGVDADDVFNLQTGVVRVCVGKIHLVEHGQHFDAQLQRRIAVGHRLRLYALRGIDHQQRAFARRQRTAHFIREVHVSGGVDQVEVVDLTVFCRVLQRRRLRLDRDAALLLDVHRVQNLGLHIAIGKAAAALDQAVGQR